MKRTRMKRQKERQFSPFTPTRPKTYAPGRTEPSRGQAAFERREERREKERERENRKESLDQ